MAKTPCLSMAFALLAVFSINSCSSFKKKALGFYLKGLQDKKAKKPRFSPPPPPYELKSHAELDAFWWNPKWASSISYFSNCSKARKSLKDFQKEALPKNGGYKPLKELSFLNGLYSVFETGPSDQKIYIGIHTTKKGECYFNLNLAVSSRSAFDREEAVFKNFIKGFRPR